MGESHMTPEDTSKVCKVITSCKTLAQLKVAKRYFDRWCVRFEPSIYYWWLLMELYYKKMGELK